MRLLERTFVAAFNHLIDQAPWAQQRLTPYAGRRVRLVSGPVSIGFVLTADGHALTERDRSPEDGGPPDVTLAVAFDRLPSLLGEGLDKTGGAIRLDGDADLAAALGFVFRNLRWDAEEDLSRVVGDIAAHRLVSGATRLHHGNLRALESVTANLGEYLTEEAAILVRPAALAPITVEMNTLRDDLARLEKRIARLERQRGTATA